MVADITIAVAAIITATTAAEVILTDLVSIAVAVVVVALVKVADISTTHTRDTMTPAHHATVQADVSTVEVRASRLHIKS